MQGARRRSALPERAGEWLALAAWIGLCLGAGVVGALFTGAAVETWYPTLRKPAWTPPAAVFGPVWTFLYVLMAVAAWRIWRRRAAPGAPAALSLFGAQLLLNTAWSGLFFGLRQPDWAFFEVVLLWLAVLATALVFGRQDRKAGWLLAPYLAWVSFAAALNLAIWQLNG
jgi:translocator protein